jgi:hypothetical protein
MMGTAPLQEMEVYRDHLAAIVESNTWLISVMCLV